MLDQFTTSEVIGESRRNCAAGLGFGYHTLSSSSKSGIVRA